ncbi:hypothetical protein AKJ09_09310 [Labilithrix luteola]|uniref:Zinc-finger domain-containing protein n=1 Tax=Labilithrix luteola TaxID=1391654 RepID=A0A0K1QAE1_9BACT|nr:hypothetical protein [Labilithrix luteola]AKV02647.1 hypothetical protein AKJ09_09310 [Labilithrix luteola]
MTCSQLEQVEELALGNLRRDEAAAARIHLLGCAECEEAHAQFVAERALFVGRENTHDVPPFLDTAALAKDVEPQPHSFLRTAQAMVAIAAGVAALVHASPHAPQGATDAAIETADDGALASSDASFGLMSTAKLASACELPSPDVEGPLCSTPSSQYFSRARDEDRNRICQDTDAPVCASASTSRLVMSSSSAR